MLHREDFDWIAGQEPEAIRDRFDERARALASALDYDPALEGLQGERVKAGLASGPSRRRVEPEPRYAPGAWWLIHRGSGCEVQVILRMDQRGIWVGFGWAPDTCTDPALRELLAGLQARLLEMVTQDKALYLMLDQAVARLPSMIVVEDQAVLPGEKILRGDGATGGDIAQALGELVEPEKSGPLFVGILALEPAEVDQRTLMGRIGQLVPRIQPIYALLLRELTA